MKLTLLIAAIEEPSKLSLYAQVAFAAVLILCAVCTLITGARGRFAVGAVLFTLTAFALAWSHQNERHEIRDANSRIEHKVRMFRLYRDSGMSIEEAEARVAALEEDLARTVQPAPAPPPRATPLPAIPRPTPDPRAALREIERRYGAPSN